MAAWAPGDRLTHRFNPELGPGVVCNVDDRTIEVFFPDSGETLRLASGSDAVEPLELVAGSRARIIADGEEVIVEAPTGEGRVRLEDGRELGVDELWPVLPGESLSERLAGGDVDGLDAFALRLDALHLAAIREADGLGSFLGGRIRLFPHQLYAAERATHSDPCRWLLADEVGLGKTVEACLVLNHLTRTGRAERALVVAPETLTVQWLGELWRKYHQVFVLIDEQRLADVERDYGHGFNPFEVYRRAVISIEFLQDNPKLTEQAVDAGIDVLIVDEAHHLRRPEGHPGNRAYRAVEPIAAQGHHALLLTATPLEEDAHGFFRLLQLLRPEQFPGEESFDERLRRAEPLPPCTSSTRRDDIGGLPPRVAAPVDLSSDEGWEPSTKLEGLLREIPADNPVRKRAKLRKIRRLQFSGPALEQLLDPSDARGLKLARRFGRTDPRIAWLGRQAADWKRAGDKTLVFVAHRESLEAIKKAMSRDVQLRVGVFHEELSPGQRDIEVAQFRLAGGPSMLISTECGGEGRNFEFCTRLVLFDLPWNPMTVEQRIGRLDRIGRRIPVEIVYFRGASRLGSAIVDLYEQIGLFAKPLGGLEQELARVEPAIGELALAADPSGAAAILRPLVDDAERAYDRVQAAALSELHRAPYRESMAPTLLSRIPEELEELTEEIVLAAADQLELHVEPHRDGLRHSIELVPRSKVDNLPGVPPGSSFLGTFDRAEAVEDESIDFFASGHPLVEGIMTYLEDSSAGRVALLQMSGHGQEGFGLLALFRNALGFEAVALDVEGRERPEWAELLMRRPLKSKRVKAESWTRQPGWHRLIRSLAARLEGHGRPAALAAFRLDP